MGDDSSKVPDTTPTTYTPRTSVQYLNNTSSSVSSESYPRVNTFDVNTNSTSYSTMNIRQNTTNNVVSARNTDTSRITLRPYISTTQYARNSDNSGFTRTPSTRIYSTATARQGSVRNTNAPRITDATRSLIESFLTKTDRVIPRNTHLNRYNSVESESSQANNKTDFKIPMSDVLMPSGFTYTITLPSKPKCFCKKFNETKLINIWPNSKLCPGEHQMLCDQMNNTIKQHVTGNVTRYEIVSIQKVKNCCLWTKYTNRRLDITKEAGEDSLNERMLFHGSSAVDDIVQTGFDERHADLSGMFGAGIYFAEHSSKSNRYVFGKVGSGCPNHDQSDCEYCERKIILCRVVLGRTKILHYADRMPHSPPGYHSVTGSPYLSGLKYSEFIIYRGEQAYPEYLIKYKVIT